MSGSGRQKFQLISLIRNPQGVFRAFMERVAVFATNVTAHKRAQEALRQAEQKYRDIFENTTEGIFQSTPDGRFIAANPALARMHGFESPEEFIRNGTDISGEIYVDSQRRYEFKRLLEESGVVRGFEHQVYRKDRSKIWISVNARAVRNEHGEILYYEGSAEDISERKRAQEAAKTYSKRLIDAQEAERQRIARELHDEIGQVLTAVKINIQTVRRICALPEIDTYLDDSLYVIDEALRQVHDLTLDLRPPHLDDLGLAAALRWYVERYSIRAGIFAEFSVDYSGTDQRLPRELETVAFRIAQEALTNVARHSRAKKVAVHLKQSTDSLVLRIKDDGVGFDAQAGTRALTADAPLGLRGMEERAHAVGGSVQIESGPSQGTEICARFQLK